MKRGFTLIELLISATIAALLMSTAIVSYTNVNKKSRDAKRQADMQSIRSALEICRSNTGTYPASIAGTVTCSDATITLSVTPVDPKTAALYPYAVGSPATTYTLTCTLELTGTCSYTQP